VGNFQAQGVQGEIEEPIQMAGGYGGYQPYRVGVGMGHRADVRQDLGQGNPQFGFWNQGYGAYGPAAQHLGGGAEQSGSGRGQNRRGAVAGEEVTGAGVPKEIYDRLAAFEKKLNVQSSRLGIEAEMRRQQAQISEEKNPGSFAQMEIAVTIYSAPKAWKGPIALMGDLSAVLKVPTSKLAFLGDELVSTGLQTYREAGEELTEEQTAAIENSILKVYRAKKAKAKELMARNPDWAKKG
jgi:hypothetical protein